ncbi:MAG: adenylate/guanylate cyclase domain-containing protein, partial [Verrucomicrobiota bacterium]
MPGEETEASDRSNESGHHRISVLLFTDIVGSVKMQTALGTSTYTQILQRHDALFRSVIDASRGRIIKHTGDGFIAEFSMSSEAVAAALRFQYGLAREQWEDEQFSVRTGLHQGEIVLVEESDAAASPRTVGMAVNLAARVMDLAQGGQILISRPVYDNARHFLKTFTPLGHDADAETPPLRWAAHGRYVFQGAEEPMEIFEVGLEGFAPLQPPPDSKKARRAGETRGLATLSDKVPEAEELDESHLMISYSYLDNIPLAEGQPGWVANLHRALEVRLGQLLGEPARLWRDPKIERKDQFNEETSKRFGNVGALVPVLSPPYLKTEACRKEMNSLCQQAAASGRPLFKVFKSPVNLDSV